MTIDIENEDLVWFQEAPQHIPGKRNKPVCLQTLHRWRLHGVGDQRVKLETVLIGGLRYTSKQAIARFFESLNRDAALPVNSGRRAKQNDAARSKLREMGAL